MEADLAWEKMIDEAMAAEIAAEDGESEEDSAMSSQPDPVQEVSFVCKEETVLTQNVSDEEGDNGKELVSPAAISVLEERDRAVSMLYLTAEEMAA